MNAWAERIEYYSNIVNKYAQANDDGTNKKKLKHPMCLTDKTDETTKPVQNETKVDRNLTFVSNVSDLPALSQKNILQLCDLSKLNNYEILMGDKRFVNEKLLYKSNDKKSDMIEQYIKLWIDTYKQQTNYNKRGGIARRAANTWLRNAV